jgi:hypothetical protein
MDMLKLAAEDIARVLSGIRGAKDVVVANRGATERNLEAISLPNEARLPIQVGNIVVSTFTAWARVEAQKHYPSDVLAGAALGYFLTAFIHDAFRP